MDNINNWIVVIFHHNTIIGSVGPFYTWTDANQWSQLWKIKNARLHFVITLPDSISGAEQLIQHQLGNKKSKAKNK
uniref:Uncharacterized protein n=1 Tax=viral metagenome TaxID=1070528 RepID=A0A6M3JGK0_9ZZZZ